MPTTKRIAGHFKRIKISPESEYLFRMTFYRPVKLAKMYLVKEDII